MPHIRRKTIVILETNHGHPLGNKHQATKAVIVHKDDVTRQLNGITGHGKAAKKIIHSENVHKDLKEF